MPEGEIVKSDEIAAAKELRALLRKANGVEKFLTSRGFDVCFGHMGGRTLSVRVDKKVAL